MSAQEPHSTAPQLGVIEWPQHGSGAFVVVEYREGRGYWPLSLAARVLGSRTIQDGAWFLSRREALQAAHDFAVWGC